MAWPKSRSGPAQRAEWMPGAPVQGRDHEARIVGQGRAPRTVGRRPGLDGGILGEIAAGLRGLGQAERGRRDGRDPERRQQRADLPHLPAIVAGDRQPGAGEAAAHAGASAARCKAPSSATPFFASVSMAPNSPSEKGASSAAAWISTIPPVAVMTKFASVEAPESSS